LTEVYGDNLVRHNGCVPAVAADQLAALLQSELARWGIPGVVAGVLSGGEAVVQAAGVASLVTGEALHESTRFRVASITKPFTATLAMLLAGEGVLQLDAPVRRALPDLRLADERAQEVVTPRQLLAHLSGLECEPAHDISVHGAGDGALGKLIATYGTLGQLTLPGAIWSYSNTGYWLAGAAIARAAGSTFEQVARELLLDPLGMRDSGFVHGGVPPRGAALGHAPRRPGNPAHDVVAGYVFPRGRVPSGGLVSTVPDLLRFAAAHLARPDLAALRLPVASAVGMRWGTGWGLEELDGTVIAAHSGSYGGFQAQLVLVPAHRVAVAVLTNSGRGSALVRTVVEWALAAACGLRRPEPVPVAVDPAPFEGIYRAQSFTVEVRAVGDRLHAAQRVRLPSGEELTPPPLIGVAVAPDRFAVLAGEARGAQFDFPGAGRIRHGNRLAVRDR
jgi:CubicO group peptidase (beta-lactamase class C family)